MGGGGGGGLFIPFLVAVTDQDPGNFNATLVADKRIGVAGQFAAKSFLLLKGLYV